MVRLPKSGIEATYYRIMNLKKDGTMRKFQVLRMCGSSWSRSEFGVFVRGEIKLNAGWDIHGYMQKKYPHWGIFWWSKS